MKILLRLILNVWVIWKVSLRVGEYFFCLIVMSVCWVMLMVWVSLVCVSLVCL